MRSASGGLASLRAATWALRGIRDARRGIRAAGLAANPVNPPPVLPFPAGRAVTAILRWQRATCLVRALVWQRWLASQGEARDLLIGVPPPRPGFRAHAWLEAERPGEGAGLVELLRWPAEQTGPGITAEPAQRRRRAKGGITRSGEHGRPGAGVTAEPRGTSRGGADHPSDLIIETFG